jgi:uncharacterized membrane protein
MHASVRDCGRLLFGVVAVIVVCLLAFDAWRVNGRTLAAAGEVGDAFGVFGLLALGIAFWSLHVQRRELSSQSVQLAEQRELQAQEIAALKAHATAAEELVSTARTSDKREKDLQPRQVQD